ncbi:MAG: hypothetical protein WCE72_16040 [Pseudolabrys sp.]
MSYTRAMVIWCLVGAMAVLTVASFVLTGLTVDLRSNPSLLLSISGILAFSFFYRYWRPNPHLRALTEVAAQFLLILIFGLLLTYAAVAVKFPYVDAGLHAIDNALGFNRQAYLKFLCRPAVALADCRIRLFLHAATVCAGAGGHVLCQEI